MIITCKACNTSFNLDEKMVKPTGSKVRCSVCANIFTAFPPQIPAPEAPGADTGGSPSPPGEDHAQSTVSGLAATATADPSADAAATDRSGPEADVLEEDAGNLLADGADLDFPVEQGAEEDAAADAEIEDAVSDALAGEAFSADDERSSDSVDESDATMIASLDDDEFDLDVPPVEEDEDGAATVIADLDQEDFDLDVPVEDDDGDGTTTVIANLDDETFALDDDFTLEAEEAIEERVPTEEPEPQSLNDLDNLNLSLDVAPDSEAPAAPQADAESAEASLDDLSLDVELDEERALDDVPAEPEPSGTSPADSELSLEAGNAAPDGSDAPDAPMQPSELEDDLDLSSLEGLLDDEADKEAAPKIEDDDVTLVIDDMEASELSLDMDDDAPADDEALEDLEFDLDGDAQADAVDTDDPEDTDQEIDLSEIEKMLEEPEETKAKFSSVPDQDLDLDIEASLETEKWMSESIDEDQLVKDEELDLSELEQVLDEVDTETAEEPPKDQELELDLSDEASSLGTADETVAVDELDFDLTDFEEAAAAKTGDPAGGSEPADMELEFEVEEDRKTEETLEDESLEETVAVAETAAPAAAAAAPPKAPEAAKTPPLRTRKPVKPAKKGVSKSLVFLLIIVILGGGGVGTYYLLQQYGIEVPFVSDYLKPKVNDPGNLKLTTYDITSKFVDNANVGKLFVVTGRVKNGYDENRSMITLVGKIFSTGKVQAQQERVYAGNVMSDLELANLEGEKIQTRLSNRLGDNRSNVKIEPGQSIPFMVVFSDLPEDLEEFTIEITSSTPLQ